MSMYKAVLIRLLRETKDKGELDSLPSEEVLGKHMIIVDQEGFEHTIVDIRRVDGVHVYTLLCGSNLKEVDYDTIKDEYKRV